MKMMRQEGLREQANAAVRYSDRLHMREKNSGDKVCLYRRSEI